MATQHPMIEPDPERENVWRIVIPITPPMHRVRVWPPCDEVRDEIERRLADGEDMQDILATGETFDF